MPTMSGSELANQAKKIRADIKILVMIAYEIDEELQKILPSTKDGFLQKPSHTGEICVAVKKHLAC